MRTIVAATAVLAVLAGEAAAQRQPPAQPAPITRETFRPPPVRVEPDLSESRRQALRRAEAAADASEVERARLRGEPVEITREQRAAIAQTYERDPFGNLHRRGEIVLATAEPGAAEAAKVLGLTETRRVNLPAAGLTLHTFTAAGGSRTQTAFEALKAARPGDAVDLNFIYVFEGAGRPGRVRAFQPAVGAGGGRLRIAAIVDGGLPEDIGALAGIRLRKARFGPEGNAGGAGGAHALAVAAVLADAAGRDGLLLLAADVSEALPVSGASAAAIAQAIDWAAGLKAEVINVSLTGPPNAALAAVVRRISARGVTVVAAAGNAGPRAAAPYPAALPEVVAVTAVDGQRRIWRRATQGPHVDFAARGVKVSAAGGEWTGTSFAAPAVAGMLLREGASVAGLTARAEDLGAPGRDVVFGVGYLAPVPPPS